MKNFLFSMFILFIMHTNLLTRYGTLTTDFIGPFDSYTNSLSHGARYVYAAKHMDAYDPLIARVECFITKS